MVVDPSRGEGRKGRKGRDLWRTKANSSGANTVRSDDESTTAIKESKCVSEGMQLSEYLEEIEIYYLQKIIEYRREFREKIEALEDELMEAQEQQVAEGVKNRESRSKIAELEEKNRFYKNKIREYEERNKQDT
ncbi:hypothetical protein ENBRE01_1522 [Enteropsectra breve]|nr:hypothetical protein ENBRE01_1522 [Enteropsectra breve]